MAKSFVKALTFNANSVAVGLSSSSGHTTGDIVLFAAGCRQTDSAPSINTGTSTYTSANLTDLGS